MRVGLLSKEYPPQIYGGAGVHVDFLSRALRPLVDLDVHTWGEDRADASGHHPAETLSTANPALATLSTDLSMAAALSNVDVVHSHTWYANLAGHLAAGASSWL
jgi:starch synthase